MKTRTKHRTTDWELYLSRREVTAGESIGVTITTSPHHDADRIAVPDIVVRGGEVTLVRTVIYRCRHAKAFGGAHAAPDRRSEIIDRQVLPAGGERMTAEDHVVARTTVLVPPDEPGTVAGTLVDIRWVVKAHLAIDGGPDIDLARTIKVLSGSMGGCGVNQQPPVVIDWGCAVLGFDSLKEQRITPGSEVSGVLSVASNGPLSARGLRVELVLRENVLHGPWLGEDPVPNPGHQEKEAEVVVATTAPASQIDFLQAENRRFPFAFTVPEQLAGPSLRTPEFTLTWILRGVMDLAWRPDPRVEITMLASTTPE
jgi:hypothetical protein